MFKKLLLILTVSLLIIGCGKTNVLQWAKAPDKADDIAMARKYLDEGEYTKAKSYVADATSKEGKIIYAECLMGEAGIDLSTIIAALNDENITDNPVIRLEALINNTSDRAKILEAADIFGQNQPSETSDIIIGTLCTMIGHVANIKNAYDPDNLGLISLNTSYNTDTALPASIPVVGGTIVPGTGSNTYGEYTNLGTAPLRYISTAFSLLSNISSVPAEVREAIVSMNAELDQINTYMSTTVNVPISQTESVTINLSNYSYLPWSISKTLCGL